MMSMTPEQYRLSRYVNERNERIARIQPFVHLITSIYNLSLPRIILYADGTSVRDYSGMPASWKAAIQECEEEIHHILSQPMRFPLDTEAKQV